MDKQPRLDTRLEAEAAEFLVLGNLLLERIPAYKTYTNMPGYDLVATNPEQNTSAKIQVKSRWRTGAPGFPIKNFGCDFIVFCRLNRGTKQGTGSVRAPEFYVFPVEVVREVWNPEDPWGKVMVRRIQEWERYFERWDLIRDFLATGERSRLQSAEPTPQKSQALPPASAVGGPAIALADFRNLVGNLEGQHLTTGKQNRGFIVRVLDGGLEFTPDLSGKARRTGWKRIERVLHRYNETRSLTPSDYGDITRNSSYLTAVLRQVL